MRPTLWVGRVDKFIRVIAPSGRLAVGIADPEVMAKLPFTGHGFRLRPVPEVIDTLQSAGFAVQHRRINDSDGAPHLLIGTPAPNGT